MIDLTRYRKVITYLDKCVEADALSHAYIFYGPDESAKEDISLKFARKILNSDTLIHPDLMLIPADIDDVNEERSINAVRQLKKFLILSPYSGKYKIAIIKGAENLNQYAQNALLKIFEESPCRSIIIICVKTIGSIPETIASRGVKLPFWHQDGSKLPPDESVIKIFNDILDKNSKKQHYCIEKLNNFKAVEIFKMWLEFLRANFLLDSNEKLAGILKISQNIYFKLNETNINHKLAYDELILNLWKF